jgi:superkiller protein 3
MGKQKRDHPSPMPIGTVPERRTVPGAPHWFWSGVTLFVLSMTAGLVRSFMTDQGLPRIAVEYTTELNELANRLGTQAALPHLRSAARIDFDNETIVARLVDESRAAGDLDEHVRALIALTRLKPQDGQVRTELVAALLQQQRFSEAYAQGRFAVWLSPNAAGAHYHFGLALLGVGQREQAAAAFVRALELDPDLQEARLGLAAALKGLSS